MMAIDKQNIRNTISPQTHTLFVMTRSKKSLGRYHKSGTGNNQGRRRKTPRDNRGFNHNDCYSKSIEMSLPVISVSLPLKIRSSIHLSCTRFFNSHPGLHLTVLVITNALISIKLTQRTMSCRHR